MWSSKLFIVAAMTSSLVMSVAGHAAIAANQATIDKITRNDVTRGSTQSCSSFTGAGTAKIQNNVVNLVAKNFNGGKDGSTFFKAALSTTGRTGKFSTVQVTKNGNDSPNGNIVSQITVAIPAGTNCAAGKCVLAFNSGGGFGNCVDLAATGTSAGAGAKAATTTTSSSAATGTGKHRHHHKGHKNGNKAKTAKKGGKREHPRDFNVDVEEYDDVEDYEDIE